MIQLLSAAETITSPDSASEKWWFEFESYILPAVLTASPKLMTAIFAQLLVYCVERVAKDFKHSKKQEESVLFNKIIIPTRISAYSWHLKASKSFCILFLNKTSY